MKKTIIATACVVFVTTTVAQVRPTRPTRPVPVTTHEIKPAVVEIFEHGNYSGKGIMLQPGTYRLTGPGDMNDMISSIKVPKGMVVMIYEHANEAGGYGSYTDLMENTPDLAAYNFNDKVSYLNIFTVEKAGGYVWARGRNENNNLVPGHWERKRASGVLPNNAPPATVFEVYDLKDAFSAPMATQAELDEFNKVVTQQSGVGILGGESTAAFYYHHNKPGEEVYKYKKVIDPARLPGAFFDWAANKLGWAGFVVKPVEIITDIAGDIKDWIFGSSSTKMQMDCWYPVSEFRQTVCGKMKEDAFLCGQDFIHTQVTVDKDICFNLIPSPAFSSMLTNRWTNETSEHIEGEIKSKNLMNFDTRTQKSTETTTPRNPMLMQVKKDANVCFYGPWMGDILDINLNVPIPLTNQRVELADLSLRKNNEIHPINQLWRKSGKEILLTAVVDNTGYFQVKGNREVEASGLNQHMRFYIAFSLPGTSSPRVLVNSPTREYEINGIAFDATDNPVLDIPAETVNLQYKGYDAVKVNLNSLIRLQKTCKVFFDKVRKRANGSIQGYIVVETERISKPGGSFNITVKDLTPDTMPDFHEVTPVRTGQ